MNQTIDEQQHTRTFQYDDEYAAKKFIKYELIPLKNNPNFQDVLTWKKGLNCDYGPAEQQYRRHVTTIHGYKQHIHLRQQELRDALDMYDLWAIRKIKYWTMHQRYIKEKYQSKEKREEIKGLVNYFSATKNYELKKQLDSQINKHAIVSGFTVDDYGTVNTYDSRKTISPAPTNQKTIKLFDSTIKQLWDIDGPFSTNFVENLPKCLLLTFTLAGKEKKVVKITGCPTSFSIMNHFGDMELNIVGGKQALHDACVETYNRYLITEACTFLNRYFQLPLKTMEEHHKLLSERYIPYMNLLSLYEKPYLHQFGEQHSKSSQLFDTPLLKQLILKEVTIKKIIKVAAREFEKEAPSSPSMYKECEKFDKMDYMKSEINHLTQELDSIVHSATNMRTFEHNLEKKKLFYRQIVKERVEERECQEFCVSTIFT